MGRHLQSDINSLESQLQERVEKLITVIRGSEASPRDENDSKYKYERLVDHEKVVTAIDDLQTIFKSIKRQLK